jgi:predicted nucleic acid-binding protein
MSNPVFVLDTHGALAYLQREPGGPAVTAKFREAANGECRILFSGMSVAELAYIVERRRGPAAVGDTLALLEELPVEIVDVDRRAALGAARIKARHPVSIGDAFVAALALEHAATVVTGDPEFKRVEHLVPVFWLQQRLP